MYVSFYFKDSIVSTAGLSHLTTFPSTCKVIRVISDRKFFKFKLYRLFQLCFELYYCQVSRFYKKLWELSFNQMSKFGRFVKANELIRVEVCVTKPMRFAYVQLDLYTTLWVTNCRLKRCCWTWTCIRNTLWSNNQTESQMVLFITPCNVECVRACQVSDIPYKLKHYRLHIKLLVLVPKHIVTPCVCIEY